MAELLLKISSKNAGEDDRSVIVVSFINDNKPADNKTEKVRLLK
jgi:hypothetical protein